MERGENNRLFFFEWVEDIWEEISIQFFGITAAIIFFVVVYFLFHPRWMKTLIDLFKN